MKLTNAIFSIGLLDVSLGNEQDRRNYANNLM